MTKKPKKPKTKRPVEKPAPPPPPVPAVKIKYNLDDPTEYKLFYDALDDGFGSTTHMTKVLGLSRMTLYRRFDADPRFKKTFYAMRGEILDKVEDLLIERATKGEMQYVYYGGRRVDVKLVPDNHLLLQLVKSRKPEYCDGSLVSVTIPGNEVNPINPNVREFIMSETGNKLAHEMLLKYMEWGEKKGINVGVGEDWNPESSLETTTERPLPKDGEAETLERRKGLKLVEGKKDEEKKKD